MTTAVNMKRPEISVMVALACAAGGFWIFVAIADELLEGDLRHVDRQLLLALRNAGDPSRPWGPLWVQEAARDITAMGSLAILAIVAAMVCGYLVLTAKRHAALTLFIAMAGGQMMSLLLKIGFGRPRPELAFPPLPAFTASFPSGHSLMAAVTYLTIGVLLASGEARFRVKLYLLACGVVIAILVGISRVYLGLHWPSDIAAGWAIGAAWAALSWVTLRWLQRRGAAQTGRLQ
jgi:undecaprenyl-diphosphatase